VHRPEHPVGVVSAGTGRDRRPLLLGGDDVAKVLDLDLGLASQQREAFSRLGRGEADQPVRLMLPVPQDGSLAFCYAARLSPGSGAVSKFGSLNPGNAAAGLPTVSATVLVLDPDDGRLVAIIEGTTLTALRTSAASALAASLLARPGTATAAVLGPGVQGRGHVRAFAHTLPLEEVRLWGRDPEATKRAAAALDQEVDPRVLAAATSPRRLPARTSSPPARAAASRWSRPSSSRAARPLSASARSPPTAARSASAWSPPPRRWSSTTRRRRWSTPAR
jgi:ornithine cyclodeaminase/alanine dehydrogenase-like protein (mu-crystallin family)